jgi:hypothetical protein
MLDGTPTLRMNEFILGSLDKGVIPLELEGGEKNPAAMPKPEEIVFELDNHLETVISKSKQGFTEEMALQDLKVRPMSLNLGRFNDRWSTLASMVKTSSRRTRHPQTLGCKWSSSSLSSACSIDRE